MKVIATNIFDFNNWYRFGFKSLSSDVIIDLDNIDIPGNPQDIFNKIGFFEEDGDVFFAELNENIDGNKKGVMLIIQIDQVKSIIPISEKGKASLSNKLTDINIGNPIRHEIAMTVLRERDHYLAEQGGRMVLKIFSPNIDINFKSFNFEFIEALDKYLTNLNFEPENLLEHIVVYERSRAYPNTDAGFLFDVGSIAKSYLGITDDDLKNRNKLKDLDSNKYEFVEEILSLSLFLQKNAEKGIFSAFISECKNSEWLIKLNNDLAMNKVTSEPINNILVLAFYLKFRHLTRNTSNLLERHYFDEIQRFIEKVPKEAAIALYLNGLFFGFIKFRELYYRYNALPISLWHQAQLEKIGIEKIRETKVNAKDSITSNSEGRDSKLEKSLLAKSKSVAENIQSIGKFSPADDTIKLEKNIQFDEKLFSYLERRLVNTTNSLTPTQIKKIKSIFDKTLKSGPITNHLQYFIKAIEKEFKETKKSIKSKELINSSINLIDEYFKTKR